MTTREELDMLTQHVETTEELIAAKAAFRDAPTPENLARMQAAKAAARELTTYWRSIREVFRPTVTDGDGVARVETVTAKTRKGG
jgi:hypothetical protein